MSKRFRGEDDRLHPDRKYKGILHPPRASRISEEDLTVYNGRPEKKQNAFEKLADKIPFLRGSSPTNRVRAKGFTAEKGKHNFSPRRHVTNTELNSGSYRMATVPRGGARVTRDRARAGFTDRFVINSLLVCVAVVVVSLIAIPTSFAQPAIKITLNDGGRVLEAETTADTVGQFLEDNRITLGEDDLLEVDAGAEITEGMEIIVRRAMPVTIRSGDQSVTVNMVSGTVQEALDKAGVVPAEADEVYPAPDTFLRSGMKIDHIVVTTDTREEIREIPFEEETIEDSKLEKGKTEVRQEGETGEYQIIFAQVYKNGLLMPETVQIEQTVKEPVKKITAVGTYVEPPPKKKPTIKEIHSGGGSSSGGGGGGGAVSGPGELPDGTAYSYAVTVRVTAYCDACNSGNSTASGNTPGQGTVAASLGQFPMGTKLFIPDYGFGRVEDTGGFSAGTIDVFLPGRSSCTCSSDWNTGSRTIYVL